MFGLFSLFSGITGLVKSIFYWKTAGKIEVSVKEVVQGVHEVLPVAQEAIKTTGDVATAVGQAAEASGAVAGAIATTAKADSDEAIAHYQSLASANDSVFAKNVRPAVFLLFSLLIAGNALGIVTLHLTPEGLQWFYGFIGSYIGFFAMDRTILKLTNLFKGAEVVKTLIEKK